MNGTAYYYFERKFNDGRIAIKIWNTLPMQTIEMVVSVLLQYLKKLEVIEVQPAFSKMRDWTQPVTRLVLQCESIRKLKVLDDSNSEHGLDDEQRSWQMDMQEFIDERMKYSKVAKQKVIGSEE